MPKVLCKGAPMLQTEPVAVNNRWCPNLCRSFGLAPRHTGTGVDGQRMARPAGLELVSHLSVERHSAAGGRETRARPGSTTTNAPVMRPPSSAMTLTIA